jgi:hydroxymethylpyrimidine pyrophosphatase-like HAD family hydrolase
MPDIRLVALDLDGTVFNDEKEITPRTLEAIRAAIAKGVDVIPATGRVASGVPEAFLRIPGVRYALTSNGASVVELSTCRLMLPLPATFMISWPQRAVPWAFLSAAKPTPIILVPMTALP